MLFIWLFALIASWANACMLQPSGPAAYEHHQRGSLAADHGSFHERAVDASGEPETDPAQEACASFCDTGQSVVAKAQPAKGESSADPSAIVARGFACWPAFTPGQAEVGWHPPAAPTPPGPPVAIAFLRLTL